MLLHLHTIKMNSEIYAKHLDFKFSFAQDDIKKHHDQSRERPWKEGKALFQYLQQHFFPAFEQEVLHLPFEPYPANKVVATGKVQGRLWPLCSSLFWMSGGHPGATSQQDTGKGRARTSWTSPAPLGAQRCLLASDPEDLQRAMAPALLLPSKPWAVLLLANSNPEPHREGDSGKCSFTLTSGQNNTAHPCHTHTQTQ